MSNVLTSSCKVPDCTEPHYRDGFCEPHWSAGRFDGVKSRYRPAKRLPASWRRTTG